MLVPEEKDDMDDLVQNDPDVRVRGIDFALQPLLPVGNVLPLRSAPIAQSTALHWKFLRSLSKL